MTRFTERIAQFRRRLEAAAAAAGRDPDHIRLVAVSKRHPADLIAAAVENGVTDFGENYLQEALPKIGELGDGPVWHFIGRVQANKTRQIAESFDWVHTVTSLRHARRLAEQRPHHAPALQLCLQVAPTGSHERAGVSEEDLPGLANAVGQLSSVRLRGLMVMPLPDPDPVVQRREFARVRHLYDGLNEQGCDLDTLSMGMSGDLEAAIMEGSTMIRVGTAIFGPRE